MMEAMSLRRASQKRRRSSYTSWAAAVSMGELCCAVGLLAGVECFGLVAEADWLR